MMLVPAKVLLVEATMPDETIEGVSTTMALDTPEHVLLALEQGLLQKVRHDFPGASEYRSVGWRDTQVLVPEDELAGPAA